MARAYDVLAVWTLHAHIGTQHQRELVSSELAATATAIILPQRKEIKNVSEEIKADRSMHRKYPRWCECDSQCACLSQSK